MKNGQNRTWRCRSLLALNVSFRLRLIYVRKGSHLPCKFSSPAFEFRNSEGHALLQRGGSKNDKLFALKKLESCVVKCSGSLDSGSGLLFSARKCTVPTACSNC